MLDWREGIYCEILTGNYYDRVLFIVAKYLTVNNVSVFINATYDCDAAKIMKGENISGVNMSHSLYYHLSSENCLY